MKTITYKELENGMRCVSGKGNQMNGKSYFLENTKITPAYKEYNGDFEIIGYYEE